MGVFFADLGNGFLEWHPISSHHVKPQVTPPGPDVEQGLDEVADEQETE